MTLHLLHETCKTTSDMTWNLMQLHLEMQIMVHDIWMKSSAYLTTLSSKPKMQPGEGNSREIFQTLNPKLKGSPDFSDSRFLRGPLSRIFKILNPKLQVIKVACNSQLLKSSSSSHATLTASFSYSSSKPSLRLGTLTASHNSQVWCLGSNLIWSDNELVD